MRAYDIMITFFCLNAGITFINVVTGGLGDISIMNFTVLSGLTIGLGIGGGILGGIAGSLTGADPLKIAVISIFAGTIVGLFTQSFAVMYGLATTLDGGIGIASVMVTIFAAFQIFFFVAGVQQIASGGGWKYND